MKKNTNFLIILLFCCGNIHLIQAQSIDYVITITSVTWTGNFDPGREEFALVGPPSCISVQETAAGTPVPFVTTSPNLVIANGIAVAPFNFSASYTGIENEWNPMVEMTEDLDCIDDGLNDDTICTVDFDFELTASSGTSTETRTCTGGLDLDGNTSGVSITLTIDKTVLPVELTRFEALPKDDMVELSWTTATELNNDYFQVEHSPNGIDFKAIGKVKGQGTIFETIDYDFIHRTPISGINYYRLKQMDFDGDFEYSNIEAVELTSRVAGVQIYPNPTIDRAVISMNEIPEKARFGFFNLLGQGFDLQPVRTEAGWEVDLSTLSSGIYVLKMEMDGQMMSKRIVKE